MGDPISAIVGGIGDLIFGGSSGPGAAPPVPQRDDPEIQRRLEEERRRQSRLRGRASLLLSGQPLSDAGTGLASKELLGG